MVDPGEGSAEQARTLASYFGAFGPAPAWDELTRWPPDVFAVANLVLDHSESYRFVVAPPPGRRWPRLPDWNVQVCAAAREWADAASRGGDTAPALVRRNWDVVSRGRETPLESIRRGDVWTLIDALLTLHATADEACANVSTSGSRAAPTSFEARAWRRLQEHGSLSRLSPTRVRIVPKTHLCAHGITIRSLSRYLALSYEPVDIRWRGVERRPDVRQPDYSIVLFPWPLAITSRDFKPADPETLENMDLATFGFFEFRPDQPLDRELLRAVLREAEERAGRLDAVVFPESALDQRETGAVERILDEFGATFLIAGMHGKHERGGLSRNYLHFGVRAPAGWERLEQDKHHRWCLDERQIRQYHLTRSLDPDKLWWEAIDVRERALHVIDIGAGVTVAPLVCEDLARLDEVADVVRRIGPSLVIAVLLDGPQLASRWPSRYASVLVDEPGSAVLTLTSLGMAARSRPPGKTVSRVVAHWNNRRDGIHEIELEPGSSAVLVSAALDKTTSWTADGRRHDDVPGIRLAGVDQLRGRGRGPAPRRKTRKAEAPA